MAAGRRANQGELTPGELLDVQRQLERERLARIADLQEQLRALRAQQAEMSEAEIEAAELDIRDAFEASEFRYQTESAAADDRLQESEKFTPLDETGTEYGWLNSGDPLAQPLERIL